MTGMAKPPLRQLPKLRYTATKTEEFCDQLSQSLNFHFPPSSLPDADACCATAVQECILSAATTCFGHFKPRSSHTHHHKPWFDDECKALRKQLSALPLTDPERASLSVRYKQLVKRKRRLHDQCMQQQLCTWAKSNPRKFWCRYKRREPSHGSISAEGWREAFQALFGPDVGGHGEGAGAGAPPQASVGPTEPGGVIGMNTPSSCPLDEQLNAPITAEEVQCAFKRLKRHKAAGSDGIKTEYLLDAEDLLLEPLVCAFNQMLYSGVPEGWCEGVIHPIFKSGDADDPANYI